MRAYIIVVDRIYEVEGKPDDDEFRVYSAPSGTSMVGSTFRKSQWASTKDFAYILLERSINNAIKKWKEEADRHDKAGDTYDRDFANEQITVFTNMLPKCREMDVMFIRRLDKK